MSMLRKELIEKEGWGKDYSSWNWYETKETGRLVLKVKGFEFSNEPIDRQGESLEWAFEDDDLKFTLDGDIYRVVNGKNEENVFDEGVIFYDDDLFIVRGIELEHLCDRAKSDKLKQELLAAFA